MMYAGMAGLYSTIDSTIDGWDIDGRDDEPATALLQTLDKAYTASTLSITLYADPRRGYAWL
jgi:hypothetical protein